MARLTKIYTRTGDDGTTGLATGARVPKDHPQVESYGAVDELNSALGGALAAGLCAEVATPLRRIQSELFNLGGMLALLGADPAHLPPRPLIQDGHVRTLEKECDALNRDLGPLKEFLLPGGTPAAAWLHLARTTCRRAERKLVALTRTVPVPPEYTHYLNRLSDLLFIMARFENRARGVADVLWDKSV